MRIVTSLFIPSVITSTTPIKASSTSTATGLLTLMKIALFSLLMTSAVGADCWLKDAAVEYAETWTVCVTLDNTEPTPAHKVCEGVGSGSSASAQMQKIDVDGKTHGADLLCPSINGGCVLTGVTDDTAKWGEGDQKVVTNEYLSITCKTGYTAIHANRACGASGWAGTEWECVKACFINEAAIENVPHVKTWTVCKTLDSASSPTPEHQVCQSAGVGDAATAQMQKIDMNGLGDAPTDKCTGNGGCVLTGVTNEAANWGSGNQFLADSEYLSITCADGYTAKQANRKCDANGWETGAQKAWECVPACFISEAAVTNVASWSVCTGDASLKEGFGGEKVCDSSASSDLSDEIKRIDKDGLGGGTNDKCTGTGSCDLTGVTNEVAKWGSGYQFVAKDDYLSIECNAMFFAKVASVKCTEAGWAETKWSCVSACFVKDAGESTIEAQTWHVCSSLNTATAYGACPTSGGEQFVSAQTKRIFATSGASSLCPAKGTCDLTGVTASSPFDSNNMFVGVGDFLSITCQTNNNKYAKQAWRRCGEAGWEGDTWACANACWINDAAVANDATWTVCSGSTYDATDMVCKTDGTGDALSAEIQGIDKDGLGPGPTDTCGGTDKYCVLTGVHDVDDGSWKGGQTLGTNDFLVITCEAGYTATTSWRKCDTSGWAGTAWVCAKACFINEAGIENVPHVKTWTVCKTLDSTTPTPSTEHQVCQSAGGGDAATAQMQKIDMNGLGDATTDKCTGNGGCVLTNVTNEVAKWGSGNQFLADSEYLSITCAAGYTAKQANVKCAASGEWGSTKWECVPACFISEAAVDQASAWKVCTGDASLGADPNNAGDAKKICDSTGTEIKSNEITRIDMNGLGDATSLKCTGAGLCDLTGVTNDVPKWGSGYQYVAAGDYLSIECAANYPVTQAWRKCGANGWEGTAWSCTPHCFIHEAANGISNVESWTVCTGESSLMGGSGTEATKVCAPAGTGAAASEQIQKIDTNGLTVAGDTKCSAGSGGCTLTGVTNDASKWGSGDQKVAVGDYLSIGCQATFFAKVANVKCTQDGWAETKWACVIACPISDAAVTGAGTWTVCTSAPVNGACKVDSLADYPDLSTVSQGILKSGIGTTPACGNTKHCVLTTVTDDVSTWGSTTQKVAENDYLTITCKAGFKATQTSVKCGSTGWAAAKWECTPMCPLSHAKNIDNALSMRLCTKPANTNLAWNIGCDATTANSAAIQAVGKNPADVSELCGAGNKCDLVALPTDVNEKHWAAQSVEENDFLSITCVSGYNPKQANVKCTAQGWDNTKKWACQKTCKVHDAGVVVLTNAWTVCSGDASIAGGRCNPDSTAPASAAIQEVDKDGAGAQTAKCSATGPCVLGATGVTQSAFATAFNDETTLQENDYLSIGCVSGNIPMTALVKCTADGWESTQWKCVPACFISDAAVGNVATWTVCSGATYDSTTKVCKPKGTQNNVPVSALVQGIDKDGLGVGSADKCALTDEHCVLTGVDDNVNKWSKLSQNLGNEDALVITCKPGFYALVSGRKCTSAGWDGTDWDCAKACTINTAAVKNAATWTVCTGATHTSSGCKTDESGVAVSDVIQGIDKDGLDSGSADTCGGSSKFCVLTGVNENITTWGSGAQRVKTNDFLTITCKPGFVPKTSAASLECGATGWPTGLWECEQIKCQLSDAAVHNAISWSVCAASSIQVNAANTTECPLPGVGGQSASAQMQKIDQNGVGVGSNLLCPSINGGCPLTGVTNDVTKWGDGDQKLVANEFLSIKCAPGYTAKQAWRKCGTNGWEGDAWLCLGDCHIKDAAVANVKTWTVCSGNYSIEDNKCKAAGDVNSEDASTAVKSLLKNGLGTTERCPAQKGGCQLTGVTNDASKWGGAQKLEDGDYLSITCNVGYEAKQTLVKCSANGWETPKWECKKLPCTLSDAGAVSNVKAWKLCSENALTSKGAASVCDEGASIYPSAQILKIDRDGLDYGATALCPNTTVPCTLLGLDARLTRWGSGDQRVGVGDYMSIECADTYGPKQAWRKCGADGWEGTQWECVPRCVISAAAVPRALTWIVCKSTSGTTPSDVCVTPGSPSTEQLAIDKDGNDYGNTDLCPANNGSCGLDKVTSNATRWSSYVGVDDYLSITCETGYTVTQAWRKCGAEGWLAAKWSCGNCFIRDAAVDSANSWTVCNTLTGTGQTKVCETPGTGATPSAEQQAIDKDGAGNGATDTCGTGVGGCVLTNVTSNATRWATTTQLVAQNDYLSITCASGFTVLQAWTKCGANGWEGDLWLCSSGSPTFKPTNSPITVAPTITTTTPTSAAPITIAPTITTNAPSGVPTESTKHPSAAPTSAPSKSPVSASPTTTGSTLHPTGTPVTAAPTTTPTIEPTYRTEAPVTSNPTTSPSPSPTENPTAFVAPQPTAPTPKTISPSSAPTTPKPTSFPTDSPSQKPTSHPTVNPTSHPTVKPSAAPSSSPSREGTTSSPSAMPTASPATEKPSASPSAGPTAHPVTAQPTAEPTGTPTTAQPTNQPTALPTTAPTTAEPTNEPTKKPSLSPSSNPTTDKPTASPSTKGTTVSPSTARPTKTPTANTNSPTLTTMNPSVSPSAAPSKEPTVQPTKSPLEEGFEKLLCEDDDYVKECPNGYMIKILEAKYGVDLVSRDVSAGLTCAQSKAKTNCGSGPGFEDMFVKVRDFCEGTEMGKRNRNCVLPIGTKRNEKDLKVEFNDPCLNFKKQFKIRAICIKQPSPTALPPTNQPVSVDDPGTSPTPFTPPYGTVTPVTFRSCEKTLGNKHIRSRLVSGQGDKNEGLTCDPGYSVKITSVHVGHVSPTSGMCMDGYVDRDEDELSKLKKNNVFVNDGHCNATVTNAADLILTDFEDIQALMPECVNSNSCLSSDTDIVFRRIRNVWKLKKDDPLRVKFDERTSECMFRTAPKYSIYPLFHGSYMCVKN